MAAGSRRQRTPAKRARDQVLKERGGDVRAGYIHLYTITWRGCFQVKCLKVGENATLCGASPTRRHHPADDPDSAQNPGRMYSAPAGGCKPGSQTRVTPKV